MCMRVQNHNTNIDYISYLIYTWEDRVNLDGFNCVFRAGKRGRRAQQVGRVVSDTSIPLPRLKTVRDKVTECVSSDLQKHVVSMWTCT